MFRVMRSVPYLQRKLFLITFAVVLIFLFYLMFFNNPAFSSTLHVKNSQRFNTKKPYISANNSSRIFILDSFLKDNKQLTLTSVYKPLPSPSKTSSNVHNSRSQPLNSLQEKNRLSLTHKNATDSKVRSTDPYSGPKNDRQKAVVDAFMHAWNAYKKYAWGHDELRPLSKSWQEWFGCALTLVDSLDTIYIMGLRKEFQLAREYVSSSLSFSSSHEVQLFEIVIRALGGLLSAYRLSGDSVFKDKALELGNKLYPCFGGPTKIPCVRISMKSGRPSFSSISTAESGTIQLEFRDLARITGQVKFEDSIEGVSHHIHTLQPKLDGLVPTFINGHSGRFDQGSSISMGASADSYYEYLLKQWIQTGKKTDWFKKDYEEAIAGMKKHLLRYSAQNHYAFVGIYSSMSSKYLRNEMEHLACFLPGTLALGYLHGMPESHLTMAKQLTETCYQMYNSMPTGLSPEIAQINTEHKQKTDFSANYGQQHNIHRPETVESLFYLYRATSDQKYRDWGWKIFQAFEKHTKLKEGYASIDSVLRPENPGHRDKMETFYLAETLKYLYLLFSDDPRLLPLDKWVFNTEAHPLPVVGTR